MAPESQYSLAEYRKDLQQRLDDCFSRRDDPDPSKRFARNGVTKEILDGQVLFQILKLLIYQGDDGADATDDDYIRSLALEIRGSETGTSPGYCNILGTLLYARCTNDCLKTWAKSLLPPSSHCPHQKPADDNDLPLSKLAARSNFGHDDGHTFWEQQYLFCPITLKESDESVYVGLKQCCRLPFLEERTKIAKGSYAIVYKVNVASGHMVNASRGWATQKVS